MYTSPGFHGELKLIDLGFAARPGIDRGLSWCGTVQYVAPEVCARRSWDEKCDLWSLGSVLYSVLTHRALFGGSNRRIRTRNRSGQVDWSSRFHELSEDAQDFLQRLLEVHPEDRPSASEALFHPWLQRTAAAHMPDVPRSPKQQSSAPQRPVVAAVEEAVDA